MVSAILLAAGSSTRMGNRNKLLLSYHGHALVREVVINLRNAGLQEIIVVTGFESQLVDAVLTGFPVRCIHNPDYALGMTTSIQQGVSLASGAGFMICLADMVKIEPAEYQELVARFEAQLLVDPSCICMPSHAGKAGNPVIFSSTYRQAILAHTEMEGCKGIVQDNRTHIHFIPLDKPHVLQDVDYPADYERLTS